MAIIFTGSTGDSAGHTLFTWAFARRLKEKGLKVGFIKPFGIQNVQVNGEWTDSDACLFKKVLDLQLDLDQICPFYLTDDSGIEDKDASALTDLHTAVQSLAKDCDILLVMGSKQVFYDDSTRHLPDISLVNELAADFILVHRYRAISSSIYSLMMVHSLMKGRIKGIILNRLALEEQQRVKEKMITPLVKKGLPIVGGIPEDPSLSFRSLQEIVDTIGGEVIWADIDLDRIVGGMTVGAANLTGSLKILKRVYNKIILLNPQEEGEDPDSSAIAGILLTGGRNPAEAVLTVARESHIPVLLAKEDTFTVFEQLEKNRPTLSSKDENKVQRFTHLMDAEKAFDGLLKSLGINA